MNQNLSSYVQKTNGFVSDVFYNYFSTYYNIHHMREAWSSYTNVIDIKLLYLISFLIDSVA